MKIRKVLPASAADRTPVIGCLLSLVGSGLSGSRAVRHPSRRSEVAAHDRRQVDEAACVAPLVVVPAEDLNQVARGLGQPESNTQEALSPMMSRETSGS